MIKVLITGASGLVGGVLRNGLGDKYELSGVDRLPIDGFDMLVADSTDIDSRSTPLSPKPRTSARSGSSDGHSIHSFASS